MTGRRLPRGRRIGLAIAAIGLVGLPLWATSSCVIQRLGGAFTRQPHETATLDAEARALLDAALADVTPARLFDHHAHLLGLGHGGTGCYVNSAMQSWAHPVQRFKFSIYLSAAGISGVVDADRAYVERLVALTRGDGRHGRALIVAFDQHHRPDGTVDPAKTEFYVPNEHVFAVAAASPELFEPAMSVHPYRPDALAELERWAERGGRFVKWLPNAMGIDPADPRCDPFYAVMKARDLWLLTHAGEEQAVEAEEDQRLGNPLRLRRPLDAGVRVVVAHCASLGEGEDLDQPGAPPRSNFALFLRLMDEPRYDGLLFGELSAVTQWNRLAEPLATLLARTDLHHRLVNGSDYPLPAVNAIVSTRALERAGFISGRERAALNQLYDVNPLLFDYVTKRVVRDPATGRRFAPEIFMAQPALARAGDGRAAPAP